MELKYKEQIFSKVDAYVQFDYGRAPFITFSPWRLTDGHLMALLFLLPVDEK